MHYLRFWAVAVAGWMFATGALAHGDSHENTLAAAAAAAAADDKPFGRAGDPKKVSRTIRIDMTDEMEYLPNGLRLRAGETVKITVHNRGRIVHELVLGTMDSLKEHAELMRRHPEMEHAEPYMVHVRPGKTETIVWEFTQPGAFYYGCLIPGHFESGMVGLIRVLPNRSGK
ncbi:MAG: cupredoxin family protein [Pseudomonadota bacterium]